MRPLCIILSFASVIAVIALVTAIVMPQVINAVTVIVKNGASSLTPYLKKLEKYPQIAQYAQSLQASLTHASSSVSKQSSDIIHGVLTGATGECCQSDQFGFLRFISLSIWLHLFFIFIRF